VTGAARVGVLGFSEGSWVVARIAAAPEAPDFLVLASAPIVTPLEQSAWIVDRRLSGFPDPVRRVPASLLATGRSVLDYLDEDPRPHLAAGRQPVLAVWGAEDATVPVTTAALRLTESVSLPATLLILPGAGHRLEERSGWADHFTAWVLSDPPTSEEVRGAAPADVLGVPGLPRGTGLTPIVSLLGATLAGVAAAYVRRPSRHPREPAHVRS
jgi:pimeloyl-ACP methyl ester carboxylesterase